MVPAVLRCCLEMVASLFGCSPDLLGGYLDRQPRANAAKDIFCPLH
jgi:hypothetical protein